MIDASAAVGTVVFNGNQAAGVLQIESGTTAALIGLTIKDGSWTATTSAPNSSGGGGELQVALAAEFTAQPCGWLLPL